MWEALTSYNYRYNDVDHVEGVTSLQQEREPDDRLCRGAGIGKMVLFYNSEGSCSPLSSESQRTAFGKLSSIGESTLFKALLILHS